MRDPAFWHVRDRRTRISAPITRLLLTPFSELYKWAGARRIERAESYDCGLPVICIGNLTVGGSGKTPIVAAIRDLLTQQGIRAASLSRGYRGELKGPLKVNTETHSAKQVGDEPFMLAASGEAWIGARRDDAARAMMEAGVEVIIMDDGHQNPDLKKDLSIVVIDGGNPVGNGFVFPKGPLREPVAAGLSRANAVIIMGDLAHDLPELSAFNGPVLHASLKPEADAPSGPLVAFAGIGRPQKFFDTLQASGAELSDAIPFPDHHTFSPQDMSYLRTLAAERDARLITTEKDFARLPKDQREDILVFPVKASFDEQAIRVLLEPVLSQPG